jgi:hypothetical protein
VYETAEGQASRPGAATYVFSKAVGRPFQLLDTIAVGLTRYPFLNKWNGLDRWTPSLGTGVSFVAAAGLILFAGIPAGRVFLLALFTVLIPYSVTWKLSSEWRLTEVAYPFYLIAAGSAMVAAIRAMSRRRVRAVFDRPEAHVASRVTFWALVMCGAVAAACFIDRILPIATASEALAAGEEITVSTGPRDGALFFSGWTQPWGGDIVTMRASARDDARLLLPLPGIGDYSLTMRIDPYPRPSGAAAYVPTAVTIQANGQPLGTLTLAWDPARFGSYDLSLPRAVVRRGRNDLQFTTSGGARFAVWYVRVRPVARR